MTVYLLPLPLPETVVTVETEGTIRAAVFGVRLAVWGVNINAGSEVMAGNTKMDNMAKTRANEMMM